MKPYCSNRLTSRAFWAIVIFSGALFLPGCSALKNFQSRLQASSAGKLNAGKIEQYRKAHAEFRAQPGWRKRTYRQADLLAQATAQNTAIEIALREQRGLLLVGGAIAMDFPVATGKFGHPTPKGTYKILDKKKDYASNLYGHIVSATGETLVSDADTREDAVPAGASFVGSRMPYWMRITPTGLGMHVGHVPGGRPASHGCIRLKSETAAQLFGMLDLGTPVTIDMFAPALGGPVGVGSVVTTEAAHAEPPERPKSKMPSALPLSPAQNAGSSSPAPPTEISPGAVPTASPAPGASPAQAGPGGDHAGDGG